MIIKKAPVPNEFAFAKDQRDADHKKEATRQ